MKKILLRCFVFFACRNKYLLKLVHKISANAFMDCLGVRHGKGCRIYCQDFGSEPYLVCLGDYVHCGTNVRFITHDGGVWTLRKLTENHKLDYIAPIKVGNNVFIGHDVILMPGVTIGDNVIIGAKSLVTKDVPSNEVWGGVPARHIKTMQEYLSQKLPKCLETKGMEPREKRKFLVKYFNEK